MRHAGHRSYPVPFEKQNYAVTGLPENVLISIAYAQVAVKEVRSMCNFRRGSATRVCNRDVRDREMTLVGLGGGLGAITACFAWVVCVWERYVRRSAFAR